MTKSRLVIAWVLRVGRQLVRAGVREHSIFSLGGGVTRLYTFVKMCQALHLKWMHFIVCKLYFNQFELRKKYKKIFLCH